MPRAETQQISYINGLEEGASFYLPIASLAIIWAIGAPGCLKHAPLAIIGIANLQIV